MYKPIRILEIQIWIISLVHNLINLIKNIVLARLVMSLCYLNCSKIMEGILQGMLQEIIM